MCHVPWRCEGGLHWLNTELKTQVRGSDLTPSGKRVWQACDKGKVPRLCERERESEGTMNLVWHAHERDMDAER